MGMTYETGKNFEKVQAMLEEHEQKINYLMIKLGEKAAAKKAGAKPTAPVETEEEEPEKEKVLDEIVEQAHETPTVKTKKKRFGRTTEEDEEPGRIL